jgi:hypothetical protein
MRTSCGRGDTMRASLSCRFGANPAADNDSSTASLLLSRAAGASAKVRQENVATSGMTLLPPGGD